MKCPKCGGEIPSGNKFCSYCGSPVQSETQESNQLNQNNQTGYYNQPNQNNQTGSYYNQTNQPNQNNQTGYYHQPNLNTQPPKKKKSPLWILLWILGWIFCFPIPAMILIWRKKNTWRIGAKITATVLLWIFIFIVGSMNGKSKSTEDPVVETTKIETSASVETSTAVETTVTPTEETTEKDEETTVAEAETATEITEEEFMAQVKDAVDKSIGENEKIEAITLEDGVLTIKDDISEVHKNLKIDIPIEELAVANASSITDSILELDTSLWDKVVIDFTNVGTVTRTKDDIVDSEYGKYFEINYLDGQEPETTEAKTSKPITDDEKTYLIVMAENIIEKYVDKPKYPWGTDGFTVVRFDDKDAVMVSTDQLTLKSSDFKQSAYVVFTYYPDRIKDFVYTEHYCEVAGVKLSDDGYCDEVFKALGVK